MTREYNAELWYERDPNVSNEQLWQDLKRAGILVFNKNPRGEPKDKKEPIYREYMKGDFKARKRTKQKYIDGVPVGKPTKYTVYLDKTSGSVVSASTRTKLLRTGSVNTGQTKWVPNVRMGIVRHGNYVCVSGIIYDEVTPGEFGWRKPTTSIGKKVYDDLKRGTRYNEKPGQSRLNV